MVSAAGNLEVLSPLNPRHPDPQHSACRRPSGLTLDPRQKECVNVLAGFGKELISSMPSPNLVGTIQGPFPFGSLCVLLLMGQENGNLNLLTPVGMLMLKSAGIAMRRRIPSSASTLKQEPGEQEQMALKCMK